MLGGWGKVCGRLRRCGREDELSLGVYDFWKVCYGGVDCSHGRDQVRRDAVRPMSRCISYDQVE